jgi:hypothetical protein
MISLRKAGLAFVIGMILGLMGGYAAHAQDGEPIPYGYGNPDPLQRDYCHWVVLDFCQITEIKR